MSGETMREAVARAICEARALPGTKPFRTSDVDRRAADAAIRTVLERLREVTPAMEDAFFEAHAKSKQVFASPAECLAAMLDAAAREVG